MKCIAMVIGIIAIKLAPKIVTLGSWPLAPGLSQKSSAAEPDRFLSVSICPESPSLSVLNDDPVRHSLALFFRNTSAGNPSIQFFCELATLFSSPPQKFGLFSGVLSTEQ